MAKVVYPLSVFDEGSNGVLYYKDGVVNDEIRDAGPGIFQSWRYSFDEGRQIFRAEKTGKIYEKRLVKDSYGNPKWTGWLNIPDGEAHGIQGIAINDGPVKLPNSDGVMKIEIDPSRLGTFTRQETYDLIEQLIKSNDINKYQYVPWPRDEATNEPLNKTPLQVISEYYGDKGGDVGILYVVAARPGVDSTVNQFIWDVDYETGEPAWININGVGQLGNFATMTMLEQHAENSELHVTHTERNDWNSKPSRTEFVNELGGNADLNIPGKLDKDVGDAHINNADIHVTATQKSDWNLKPSYETFDAHVNLGRPENYDTSQKPLLHITQEQRDSWDSKVNAIPTDTMYHMGHLGEWAPAFIQVGSEEEREELIFTQQIPIRVASNPTLIDFDWDTVWRNYRNKQVDINKIEISFTSFNTLAVDAYFEVDGTDRRSPAYNSSDPTKSDKHWSIVPTPGNEKLTFSKLYVRYEGQPAGALEIYGFKVKAFVSSKALINIGDYREDALKKPSTPYPLPTGDKHLPINFIGPEDTPITYNGNPIFNQAYALAATKHAEWGYIGGAIEAQSDLTRLITKATEKKLNAGPAESELRYDNVNGNGWIPSLVQQKERNSSSKVILDREIQASFANGQAIVDNVMAMFESKIPAGAVLSNVIISANSINPDQRSGGIYFVVDNDYVLPSVAVPVMFEDDTESRQLPDTSWGKNESPWKLGPRLFDKITVYSINGGSYALDSIEKLEITAYFSDYKNVLVSEYDVEITYVQGQKVNVGMGFAGSNSDQAVITEETRVTSAKSTEISSGSGSLKLTVAAGKSSAVLTSSEKTILESKGLEVGVNSSNETIAIGQASSQITVKGTLLENYFFEKMAVPDNVWAWKDTK
jgi:hypothetical protein